MTPPYLLSLQTLLTVAQDAASLIDATLPHTITSLKWQVAHYSPDPWNTIYHRCVNDPAYDPALLMSLLVRSELAVCIEKIQGCVVKVEAEGRPIDLRVAKTRRRT